MASLRAIRPLKQSSARHSRVQGWADIPRMATVASGSRTLVWLHDRVSTRLHALRRMAVSRLKMLHFSLCKIARSEPSRVGAGTWRRQVQGMANPRCRRVRIYTNQRGFNRRSNGQDEPAGRALLGGLMGQLHNRSARAVQLNLRFKTGRARRTGQALGLWAHNIRRSPANKGWDETLPGVRRSRLNVAGKKPKK